jgi:hypothetical protein
MNILPGEANPALKNLRKNSRPLGMLNIALRKNAAPVAQNQRNILQGINTQSIRNTIKEQPLVPVKEREDMGETLIEQKPPVETGSWFSKLFGGSRKRKAIRKASRKVKKSRKAKKTHKSRKASRKGRKSLRKH